MTGAATTETGECWYCGDAGVSLGGEGVCGECEPHLAADWREAMEDRPC